MKTHIAILISFLLINCLSGQVPSYQEVEQLSDEGKYKKALNLLDQIIEAHPPKAYLYSKKGFLQVANKDIVKGVETLMTAEKLMPDSLVIYDMLANIYLALDRFEDGRETYQRAYVRCRDNVCKSRYLAYISGILNGIQKFKEGKKASERALLLDSTNLDAYNNLARYYMETNKPDEALKYLKDIISVDSSYVGGYINIGFTLQNLGRFEESIPYFNEAIDREADFAYAYSNRSFSKLQLKDLEGAMMDINKSLALDHTNPYAYKIRALIHLENGKRKAACKDLDKAIDWNYTKRYGSEVKLLQAEHCN